MGTQPLTTSPIVDTEVLRVYEVTIERPDLTDDDGGKITYTVEVPLRYTHEQADRRSATGFDARSEAARRACKRERREYDLDLAIPLYADPESVRLVRSRIVPGRVK